MYNLNFTMNELIKSDKAKQHNINNMPTNAETLDNMLILIIQCLQPLRNFIGKPIIVNSGYRCQKLNTLVNGAPNSQHLTGQACDFVVQGLTINQIIEKVKASGIEYDQLIDEKHWVHISYNKNKNRKQFLKY